MSQRTEYDPLKMYENAILLVIRNPRPDLGNYGEFIGCYGSYQEYLKDLTERHDPERIAEVLSKDDLEDVVLTQKDFAEYMSYADEYVIPQYQLDRSKPIYVGMNNNLYFLWISNTSDIKAAKIKKYVFSSN
jgi:hypothetical protein